MSDLIRDLDARIAQANKDAATLTEIADRLNHDDALLKRLASMYRTTDSGVRDVRAASESLSNHVANAAALMRRLNVLLAEASDALTRRAGAR